MRASGVWFGNEAWPSGSSPGAFAREVFRLERCASDRDRAMAFNSWFVRCMNRGPVLLAPCMGGHARSFDTTAIFTSWGHDECTGWAWVAVEALQAAGVKARRAVIRQSGHSIYEVWYAAKDGKEGWHAFDPFLGVYFLDDAGEVASCDELAANPDLVINPRPGGRSRLGHHTERSKPLNAYQTQDQLDIVQPVRGDEARFEPQVGQQYSSLWRPEIPELAWSGKHFVAGAHDDISLYDEQGKVRYPEHLPYWKNYVWATENSNGINGTEPVRWHGCGALRWQPLRWGQKATSRCANALFEGGAVRPTGMRKHCEIWWHIQVPYLATYLRINSAVDAGAGDLVGFAVSPDDGRTVQPIHWGKGAPPSTLLHGATPTTPPADPSEAPGSIRGLREFWFRLDMSTQSAASPLRVRGLQLTVGYQHNMNLLPRLLPGENVLYLHADKLEGIRLTAEWNYTHPQSERSHSVTLDKAGSSRLSINPQVDRPEDLIMRGVTLQCDPAEGK